MVEKRRRITPGRAAVAAGMAVTSLAAGAGLAFVTDSGKSSPRAETAGISPQVELETTISSSAPKVLVTETTLLPTPGSEVGNIPATPKPTVTVKPTGKSLTPAAPPVIVGVPPAGPANPNIGVEQDGPIDVDKVSQTANQFANDMEGYVIGKLGANGGADNQQYSDESGNLISIFINDYKDGDIEGFYHGQVVRDNQGNLVSFRFGAYGGNRQADVNIEEAASISINQASEVIFSQAGMATPVTTSRQWAAVQANAQAMMDASKVGGQPPILQEIV